MTDIIAIRRSGNGKVIRRILKESLPHEEAKKLIREYAHLNSTNLLGVAVDESGIPIDDSQEYIGIIYDTDEVVLLSPNPNSIITGTLQLTYDDFHTEFIYDEEGELIHGTAVI